MVRKHVRIATSQAVALKRWSRAYGVSEAELVRRALDAALAGDADVLRRPGGVTAAEELQAIFDRIARTGTIDPEAYDRSGLYA